MPERDRILHERGGVRELRPRDEQENKYFYSLTEGAMSSQARADGSVDLHFRTFNKHDIKETSRAFSVCAEQQTISA